MHLPKQVADALGLDERATTHLPTHLRPVPFDQLLDRGLFSLGGTRTLNKRASSTSSSSSETTSGRCSGDNADTAVCEKPSDGGLSTTVIIVLSAAIPITIAAIILIVLHRRHVKKLAREDANDKHKSLDFGLDDRPQPGPGPNGIKAPAMTEMSREDAVSTLRADKGMSMDMGSSPYLLPPGAQGSRESVLSMAKSLDKDDNYRKASQAWGDSGSVRSQSQPRRYPDDNSSYAGSIRGGDEMTQSLMRNAQRMSRSNPPTSRNSMTLPSIQEPEHGHQLPERGMTDPMPRLNTRSPASPTPLMTNFSPVSPSNSSPSGLSPGGSRPVRTSSRSPDIIQPQQAIISSPVEYSEPTLPVLGQTTYNEQQQPTIPRLHSMEAPTQTLRPQSDQSDYGDITRQNPTLPTLSAITFDENEHNAPAQTGTAAKSIDPEAVADLRRMTMGLRPLPPDDPTDNPEQRANRIRSFYKEYFDDSRPHPAEYQEDYDQDYLMDGAMYDPNTGAFVMANQAPFAEGTQGMQRRAMTPPPRFQSAAPMHLGLPATPRMGSSASGQMPRGPGGPPAKPKKKAPPPAPLQFLPTPHMLTGDYQNIAIDFVPPSKIRDAAAGVPASPKGGLRPYSPAAKGRTPVISAFDELAVIPSPHALRKSGSFTSLDFAPPSRFITSDNNSDAGSIRSNRTGVSRVHAQGIRNGAYRLSRVPKGVVGTKDDFAVNLRPTWGLRDP